MKTIKLDTSDLQQQAQVIEAAVNCLRADGLVIYPTETVYGIGASAVSTKAVDKLLTYKGRREGKPLSIAVTDQAMAEKYVHINEQALKFYKNFLPGPFTVVSKSKNLVDQRVNSEFGTLGIRIPDYPLITEIVKKFGSPITSTSANASGQKRPYTITDVFNHLSTKQQSLVDLVIDAGQLPANEPSVVVDTTLTTPIALRGSLQKDQAEVLWSSSETETMELAGRLMLNHLNQLQKSGLVFALNGPLGMGKTIFAKGIAKFLNIQETISSPTYSYINEYDYKRHDTQGVFYHIDAWKIDQQQDLAFLEIKNLIKANNVVAIEWFSQIEDWLKLDQQVNLVKIDFAREQQKRKILING